MILTITQYHSRYVVECSDRPRLHILNYKSMNWHLKHVLKLTDIQRNAVFFEINTHGVAKIELVQQAAS